MCEHSVSNQWDKKTCCTDRTSCFRPSVTWIQSHGKKTRVCGRINTCVSSRFFSVISFSGVSSSTWYKSGSRHRLAVSHCLDLIFKRRLASAIRIQTGNNLGTLAGVQVHNGYWTRTEGGSKYLIQSSACPPSGLSKTSESFGSRDWIPIERSGFRTEGV